MLTLASAMSTLKASASGRAIAHSRALSRPPHSFSVRLLSSTPEHYRAARVRASQGFWADMQKTVSGYAGSGRQPVENRHRPRVVGVEALQHGLAERALEEQRRQHVAQPIPTAVVHQRVFGQVRPRRSQEGAVVEPGLLPEPARRLLPGREVLRLRVGVEIIEEKHAVARVVHGADALRVAGRDDVDVSRLLAHAILERPEEDVVAQRFGALDGVRLHQDHEVEARAMELIRAAAEERRFADRRDEDRLEGHGLEHARVARDACAPARRGFDQVAFRPAGPQMRVRIDFRGEQQIAGRRRQQVAGRRRLGEPRFAALPRAEQLLEITLDELVHSWLMPPSATISEPSRNDESELARNSAVFAISSGRPKRLIRISETMACRVCSRASGGIPRRPKIGVATGPGLMALTRMLRPTSSADSVRASDRSAALLAA